MQSFAQPDAAANELNADHKPDHLRSDDGDFGPASTSVACVDVCVAFYQDMNLQCSEEALVQAMRRGARATGRAPPRAWAWRFDQVEDCPYFDSDGRCTHGMELGWMFGTIHALPDGTRWRSERLDTVVGQADMLVVEVANLENGEALSALFEQMAYDRPAGPIAERIDPELRGEFEELLVKAKVRRGYFDPMESWAAALALAQVAQTAKAENGADRALLAAFDKREVVELEGARTADL